MQIYKTQGIKNTRIDVADALRGIAVAGIILFHSVEHFNMYDASLIANPLSCDRSVFKVMQWLFSGKMYGIFAMLFGLSFFIMNDNQQQRGNNFSGRFAWRMVLLFILGIVNTALYDGDILMSYAVYGLLLIPISYLPTKYVWAIFGILIIQPIELYSMFSGWHVNMKAMGQAYATMGVAHHTGSFIDNCLTNLRWGQVSNTLWYLAKGRVTQTIALFILGMLLGRLRMFYNEGNNLKIWARIFFASLALVVIGSVSGVTAIRKISTWITPIHNFFILMMIVSGVVLLWYRTSWCPKLLSSMRTFGKMSLTNYFLQSIIGCGLFCHYGFNLSAKLCITYALLVGIAMVVCQYFFCVLWFRKHDHGPLEALWKKLTWIKF